ncbi:MAG: zinc ribbon domain-containing protein [Chloroflexi bacterium]|jgi:hypothetical protein|nr:zinc ribbon domain-containing protein [Chloroflexota bacterium]MBT3669269.1 zinc ribbon domain-containing protein [Chloroflexota bacterium]MBT4003094.1 zinc ribbon domain-containing protein [Chloroflexota bacterium]MBT4305976.1 zinc ribbon domain-containing protein [Chloroflexota bacterium]MBT4532620.1 zinc ribbon domain-containing protein [Chloroflexota bacterium]
MDIGSILLVLALVILVAVYVSMPFRQKKSLYVSEEEHTLSALLAERDRILNALMELDFDYDLEKIPEEIYPLQRNSMLERGADILRQLDAFYEGSSGDASDRLEATVAARRADAKKISVDMDDPLETIIAARKENTREVSTNNEEKFCHNCGQKVLSSDQFCTKCGTTLD